MKNLLFCILVIVIVPFALFGKEKVLRFHYLTTENGLPRNTAYSVTEDKYGFIWIATIDGLCRFDGYHVKLYNNDASNPNSLVSNRPRRVIRDNQGDIWVMFASLDPFCRYNYETDNFTRIEKNELPAQIRNLFAASNRNYTKAGNTIYRWNIKNNLLWQTNIKTHQQFAYHFNPKNSYGLKDELVTGVYLDSRNTLWVTTDAGGVAYADVNQPDFNSYLFTEKASKSISETAVRAICQSVDGDLWLGTRQSGVTRIRKSDNSQTSFRHNHANPQSLSDDRVRKIYKDKYGQLWFGTKSGVDRLNPESNRFRHYPAIENIRTNNWVYAIEEDNQGELWIGTWQAGIARYDRANDRFIPYWAANPDFTWNVRVLLRDGSRDLWIGTEDNGLTLLKRSVAGGGGGKERSSFVRFRHKAQDEHSLSDNRIYCLAKDRDGFLWIGTGKGLNCFDPRTRRFIHFPDKRFISNGMIFGILNDTDGNLWVSHQHGLTRINSKTFRTCDYNTHSDLFDNEFTEDAYYRNPETGECFFGSNQGFISFNPVEIKDNATLPRVVVTGLRISDKSVEVKQKLNGRVILEQPVYLTKSFTLKWEERNLELEFAALHFTNPRNNTYSYRLTGFDKEWKNTDATNRVASYTNLPAGKYLFEVRAAGSNGIWSEKPATLEIIILPPWWMSWWAYLLYAFCISGLIYLAYRIVITREKLNHQIQIERLKAEKAKELEELKSTFFTNVSHELRTPLTLIIDPVKTLVEGMVPDAQTTSYFHKLIYENSKRLLALVNQLLDLKKVESGEMKLNLFRVEVVSKIKSLVSMFELQARDHRIKLGFRSSEKEIVAGVDIDKLDKIILNLLSNAFKFTPDGGTIQVEITQPQGNASFDISVKDDGVGIPAEKIGRIFDPFYQVDGNDQKNGTGIGLSLVKDFVALHEGTVSVDSEVGQGSCFRLTFPLNDNGELISGEAIHSGEIDANSEVVINTNETVEETANELPVILVVEDNAEVRQYLQTILQEDFRVITAADGREGVDIAVETIPDLVVSDIMMPEVSGVELCERLKTDQRTSHIPVVLLTARQSEELKITGYETGADDYITKPFSSATLIARIKNLIESRHKLRQLFDKSTGYNTKVIAANQVDKLFLDTLVNRIHENMAGETFDAEELASMMNMSRVQLNRKIKSLTDKTTKEFVLTVRLNKAAELLLSGLYNVNEVSVMVGYSEPGNFTRSFTRQFGVSPKSYLAGRRG